MKAIFSIIIMILSVISLCAQSTVNYTFDKQGRLMSEHFDSVYKVQFNYDKEGNIQSKTLTDYTVSNMSEIPVSQNQVVIRPNPATDQVIIEVRGELKTLQINLCDANGKVIQRIKRPKLPAFLPVANLTNGLYFIEVAYEGKTDVFKLIKN